MYQNCIFKNDRVHLCTYKKKIKKLIAKVQMFMFGLTCFKGRKAKTLQFFLIYREIYLVTG